MKLVFIIVFLISLSLSAFSQVIIGSVPLEKNKNLFGNFVVKGKNPNTIIISRPEYVLSYNRSHRELDWVAWEINSSSIGHTGRAGNFAADSELERALAPFSEHVVGPNDYKGSCFDRGHQVPSGDRTSTVQANQSVFYMSNMIPQTAFMNKGAWNDLENYIRDRVLHDSKKALVIAGPIFDQDFGKIGPKKDIFVPSKNFKVVFFLNEGQTAKDINKQTEMIAVVIANTLSSGKTPVQDRQELCDELSNPRVGSDDWESHKTNLAQVQKLTGINFSNFISKK